MAGLSFLKLIVYNRYELSSINSGEILLLLSLKTICSWQNVSAHLNRPVPIS